VELEDMTISTEVVEKFTVVINTLKDKNWKHPRIILYLLIDALSRIETQESNILREIYGEDFKAFEEKYEKHCRVLRSIKDNLLEDGTLSEEILMKNIGEKDQDIGKEFVEIISKTDQDLVKIYEKDKENFSKEKAGSEITNTKLTDVKSAFEKLKEYKEKEGTKEEDMLRVTDEAAKSLFLLDEETRNDLEYHFICDEKNEEYDDILRESGMRDHFKQVLTHKGYIFTTWFFAWKKNQEFSLCKAFFHDWTKYVFFIAVGYGLNFGKGVKTSYFDKAWRLHFTYEAHHPEHFKEEDAKETEDENGIVRFDKLNRMTPSGNLIESALDKVSMTIMFGLRRLENDEEGRRNYLRDIERIITIGGQYLSQYHQEDKKRIQQFLEEIKDSRKDLVKN
jgi:uncharacterized surface protein with fasciclin (FAS1) repeats